MAASEPPADCAAGVQRQLQSLVTKYPSDDRQRLALHAALLADVTSADAWACVLQHEVWNQRSMSLANTTGCVARRMRPNGRLVPAGTVPEARTQAG